MTDGGVYGLASTDDESNLLIALLIRMGQVKRMKWKIASFSWNKKAVPVGQWFHLGDAEEGGDG